MVAFLDVDGDARDPRCREAVRGGDDDEPRAFAAAFRFRKSEDGDG